MGVLKRLFIVLARGGAHAGCGLLFTYDMIKIEWVSFMAIQNSFKPQRDPLPVPAQSVPVQGAAYIAELGAPANPVAADEDSIKRGKASYENTCFICHGRKGGWERSLRGLFEPRKPVSLLDGRPLAMSDGEIFMTITNGVEGAMPHLRENLPGSQYALGCGQLRPFAAAAQEIDRAQRRKNKRPEPEGWTAFCFPVHPFTVFTKSLAFFSGIGVSRAVLPPAIPQNCFKSPFPEAGKGLGEGALPLTAGLSTL